MSGAAANTDLQKGVSNGFAGAKNISNLLSQTPISCISIFIPDIKDCGWRYGFMRHDRLADTITLRKCNT